MSARLSNRTLSGYPAKSTDVRYGEHSVGGKAVTVEAFTSSYRSATITFTDPERIRRMIADLTEALAWMDPTPAPEPDGEFCGLCPDCAGPDGFYLHPCGKRHECDLCEDERTRVASLAAQ
jgi:hypothetical protein